MVKRKYWIPGLALAGLLLLVTGCKTATVGPTAAASSTAVAGTPTPVPPTPEPTKPPERSLVVCLGQEPQTLYAYAGASREMWSILEAVYDGPFDTNQYSAQPVILEKIPSLKDGDAKLQPVKVKAGDEVVDVNGNLTNLTQGVSVLPSGCAGPDCAAAYDGTSELTLDQMVVTFKIKPGIQWSDGTPLTAADSVFSYKVAADPATPVSKHIIDNTAEYKAVDAQTVQWTGKPGFIYNRYFANFWLPLPEHLYQGKSAADILADPQAAEKPLGWGPYSIQEWTRGDHITLSKNPKYFRASEGLPKFDNLVFRFLGDQGDSALSALQTGECDVIDPSIELNNQVETVLNLQKAGKLQAAIGLGPEWEHIELGIKPASYDDQTTIANRRPDFFGDARVRQAFAYCMDRQGVINKQLAGQSPVPGGYLTPDNPLAAKDLQQYPYDPAKGNSLLDEVGWKDDDNNPSTPRKAVGVPGVPDGTALEITYLTTQAALRQAAAGQLAESIQACGISVKPQYLTPDELYGVGPDGPLFGRKFDLAGFAWSVDSQTPCYLYESSQVPNANNHWVGANVSGYSSPEFDAACSAARSVLPDQPGYQEKSAAVQQLFAKELPAIPLYFQLKIDAARPDLCGLSMDVTARSALWNIEALDYGDGCKK